MSDPRFVHLRVHSEFSIADGIVRLDDIVKSAAEDGQGALALTDLGNAFGLVRFYKEARDAGIKPIAGCDVWITNHDDRDKPSRLLLLVKDKRGYLNLCELLSKAWLTNQYRGRAELDASWLEGELAKGCSRCQARSRATSASRSRRATRRPRAATRSAGRGCSRAVSISNCSATASRARKRTSSRRWRSRRS
ncbi:PHP domain protein [Burkholderia pseudomallei]|nr:PHP domain protein [Burkholderia pseudomallei]